MNILKKEPTSFPPDAVSSTKNAFAARRDHTALARIPVAGFGGCFAARRGAVGQGRKEDEREESGRDERSWCRAPRVDAPGTA